MSCHGFCIGALQSYIYLCHRLQLQGLNSFVLNRVTLCTCKID